MACTQCRKIRKITQKSQFHAMKGDLSNALFLTRKLQIIYALTVLIRIFHSTTWDVFWKTYILGGSLQGYTPLIGSRVRSFGKVYHDGSAYKTLNLLDFELKMLFYLIEFGICKLVRVWSYQISTKTCLFQHIFTSSGALRHVVDVRLRGEIYMLKFVHPTKC